MSKETYLEMCEMLGNEPIESEMPVEFSDFPTFIQQIFQIYFMLKDIWDPVGGNYLGKDTGTIFDFFRLYSLEKEEQILAVTMLQSIDAARSKVISGKKQATKPLGKKA